MRLIAGLTRLRPPQEGLDGLSSDERDVLALVARGRFDAEIDGGAAAVAGVLAKLGARDRIHAVLLVHESRLA